MENLTIGRLLLKTAFSCMACDGDIDEREVKLIKSLSEENKIFGELDVDEELERLLAEINFDGNKFLREYFSELSTAVLSEKDELNIVEVAIETIKADDKIEYSEVKFFKVIRSKLKISNATILESHSDFAEYLEQDIISESYLAKLQFGFFDSEKSPNFQKNDILDSDLIKNIESEGDSSEL